MPSLFEANAPRPLADRLRPQSLDEVVGQAHLLGHDGPLGRMVRGGRLASIILWGPPGCGKTTIARLLARAGKLEYVALSAVFSGVQDLKKAFARARELRDVGKGTLLFVDEIHRFNRTQQDAFLPVVEDGTVTLVGATTENPSFELNAALLSRAQVLVVKRLDEDALGSLAARAERELGRALPLDDAARQVLLALADGDGRYLLNLVEELATIPAGEKLAPNDLGRFVQRRAPRYDKSREEHFNLISALHKALRGSDPDAAVYWFARMIEGGEDPRYVARRLVRFATEDVGLADPVAVARAIAGWEAYERLGSPEGDLALAQVVIDLAAAPKSNAVYVAWNEARHAANETGSLAPPAHVLNAPTPLMKELGYGEGYKYDHDQPDAFSGQNHFPESMPPRRFYRPTDRGDEARLRARLAELERRRQTRA